MGKCIHIIQDGSDEPTHFVFERPHGVSVRANEGMSQASWRRLERALGFPLKWRHFDDQSAERDCIPYHYHTREDTGSIIWNDYALIWVFHYG